MKRIKLINTSLLLLALFTQLTEKGFSQGFGRNKPNYRTFDFRVKESPHFLLHYYLKDDTLANSLVEESERWYLLHQRIFRDTFPADDKNPILFYNNHADFQQTNAISGSIGVGTGGVTEGLRTRVVMPVMELNSQTSHVLGHELVHAFQYRMMKDPEDSVSLNDLQNIPLWMIEGLAEYMSVGNVDTHTAMWMRDAVRTNDIPTLKKMTRSNEYFPYRYGQAFWSFVAGVYGDTVIYPLFRKTAMLGYDQALKEVTGLDEKAFSEAWRQHLISYYGQFKKPEADSLAGKLLINEKKAGEINIAPSISPNGQYVAFLSEKNLFSIDLFLADAQTGEVLKTLSSTARNSHIDDLSFIESAGTWSPYGDRFAFVVFSEGKNMLSIIDLVNRNKTTTVEIPGVPSLSNPTWSPNGETIVVAGTVEGRSDLYLYNIRSGKVMQLTNDRYSDIQPQWSPDGNYILFVSDRAGSGRTYHPASLQVCLLNIQELEITVLDFFHGAANLNPVFSPGGDSIYFLSNRDGFRNLYSYSLRTGEIFQMTNYYTGISGITAYTPAISVSSGTGDITYTYFADDKYSIHKAKPSDFKYIPVAPDAVDFSAGSLPPQKRVANIVNEGLRNLSSLNVEAPVETLPYKPKLSLEYIGNSVGIGISTSSFGTNTGMAGGVNMLFGDMLGNHRLYGVLALNGEIYDFGAQVLYLNQKRRINWGVSLSHIPYRYSALGLKQDTLQIGTDTLVTENLFLDVFRQFEKSASGFLYFPISTTKRLELGTGYSFYSYRVDRYNTHYYEGYPVAEDREKVEAPEGYRIGNTYVAYVLDNSYFGIASPLRGRRFRIQADKIYDELDYHAVMADFRQYIFLGRSALAFRVMHIGRHGQDAESERIYPLSFAYPQLTRGNDLDNTETYGVENDQAYSISQIFGSRILVANAEWRVPFTGPERLSMIKSKIFFTELALFADGGIAWDSDSRPTLSWTAESPQDRIPFLSTGISLRVNLFGQIVIEPYYALPWRKDHFSKGKFGMNIVPGW